MTTPTQLQQLARETAEKCDTVWQDSRYYSPDERQAMIALRILSALEQVSREERKEAQALAEDKARLDWLDRQGDHVYLQMHKDDGEYGDGWRASVGASSDGEIVDLGGSHSSIRGAIDAALAAWKEKQP